MATLSTTVKMPSLPAGERMQFAACDSLSGLLRCAVVSTCAERLESIRLAAEQEAWEAIVCRDASEMLRCAFRECLPLSIVDMPPAARGSLAAGDLAASNLYGDYRSLTERLCELSDSSMLLVVCADMESVQEEIWARQLGVWSYLPLANLLPGQQQFPSQGAKHSRNGKAQDRACAELRAYPRTDMEVSSGRETLNHQTVLGRAVNTENNKQGLPFVLCAARKALAKIDKTDTNAIRQWNMRATECENLDSTDTW